MRIAVITNDELKSELLAQGVVNDNSVYWMNEPGHQENVDCIIDLLFEPDESRIAILQKSTPSLILVNDVPREKKLPNEFIAFNGWPGFMRRSLVELGNASDRLRDKAGNVFSFFQKKPEWVPDQPGFISARIVAMIINEAYHALGEGVSTRDEIDTAMKLGTNYPYGPFEWSARIGIKNVYSLLNSLSHINKRYEPAPLLKEEAGNS
jgi:3-hydroxybutyryl-CoA dehydrogenase